MGEYSPGEHRPEDGGLYPLEEEGTYGRVPRKKQTGKWTGPQPYVRRERKTKMYASYGISDKCELHALVLGKYDRRAQQQQRQQPRQGRAASAPPQYHKGAEKEEGRVEQAQRGQSLPPSHTNDTNLEELNMLSRLKLTKEVEEDTIGSLQDILGEENTQSGGDEGKSN